MTDTLTILQRHANMAAIKGKDTKPEMVVRRFLWSHGFRYRLNHRLLPGKPDVVLRKYRTCVFVNGCFWHGHRLQLIDNGKWRIENDSGAELDSIENSECCKVPHTNREFWVRKIMRNKERDVEVQRKLAEMGWHCITVWECELKGDKREQTLESLAYTLNKIYLHDHSAKPMRYTLPEDDSVAMAAENIRQDESGD